jgi:hypothetical protein
LAQAVLQDKFSEPNTPEGFQDVIRDGQRLCLFVNCIRAGIVRKINKNKVHYIL